MVASISTSLAPQTPVPLCAAGTLTAPRTCFFDGGSYRWISNPFKPCRIRFELPYTTLTCGVKAVRALQRHVFYCTNHPRMFTMSFTCRCSLANLHAHVSRCACLLPTCSKCSKCKIDTRFFLRLVWQPDVTQQCPHSLYGQIYEPGVPDQFVWNSFAPLTPR